MKYMENESISYDEDLKTPTAFNFFESTKNVITKLYDGICFVCSIVGFILKGIGTIILGILVLPIYLFFACMSIVPLLLGLFLIFWLLFSFGTF